MKNPTDSDRTCTIEILLQLFHEYFKNMIPLWKKNIMLLVGFEDDHAQLMKGSSQKVTDAAKFTQGQNGLPLTGNTLSWLRHPESFVPRSLLFSSFVHGVLRDEIDTDQQDSE